MFRTGSEGGWYERRPRAEAVRSNSLLLSQPELEGGLKSSGRWRCLLRGRTGAKAPGSWLPRSLRIARRAEASALGTFVPVAGASATARLFQKIKDARLRVMWACAHVLHEARRFDAFGQNAPVCHNGL